MRLRKAAHLAAIALFALIATFTVGVGISSVQPEVAGAQTGGAIIPCPGSPYGNGWFNTANYQGVQGSVNCSQQNNHIVIDVYNSRGVRTQAAIDLWYGSPCDHVTFVQGGGTSPFKVALRNDSYGYSQSSGCGIHGVPIAQNSWGSWTQSWTTTWTNTVNMCHVLQVRYCGTLDGYANARAYGINNGPYTPISFSGYAGCWCANQFKLDIYPLITS